ncbi:MAG: hypothetical protein Q9159_000110 [Coniocarpon cinnabarinum]
MSHEQVHASFLNRWVWHYLRPQSPISARAPQNKRLYNQINHDMHDTRKQWDEGPISSKVRADLRQHRAQMHKVNKVVFPGIGSLALRESQDAEHGGYSEDYGSSLLQLVFLGDIIHEAREAHLLKGWADREIVVHIHEPENTHDDLAVFEAMNIRADNQNDLGQNVDSHTFYFAPNVSDNPERTDMGAQSAGLPVDALKSKKPVMIFTNSSHGERGSKLYELLRTAYDVFDFDSLDSEKGSGSDYLSGLADHKLWIRKEAPGVGVPGSSRGT